MSITMYHNPKCSKSRETLAMLRDRGLEPDIIEYLQTPPDRARLQEILQRLDISPRALLRSKEAVYAELGLDDPSLSDEQLIDAILANPILMERPIVLTNGRAAIGRPPENVLAIL